jgi:hypothetical protein
MRAQRYIGKKLEGKFLVKSLVKDPALLEEVDAALLAMWEAEGLGSLLELNRLVYVYAGARVVAKLAKARGTAAPGRNGDDGGEGTRGTRVSLMELRMSSLRCWRSTMSRTRIAGQGRWGRQSQWWWKASAS